MRKNKWIHKMALLCIFGTLTLSSLSAQAMPGLEGDETISIERIDLDSPIRLPENSDSNIDSQQINSENDAETLDISSEIEEDTEDSGTILENSELDGEIPIEQNPLVDTENKEFTEDELKETVGDLDLESESPFSVDGNATILDNVQSGSKHFYTIVTEDGNTFYLVIDEAREDENVYFLDAAKEKDLVALAKEAGQLDETETIRETLEPTEESTQNLEEKVEQESNTNWGSLFLLLLIFLAALGVGYYIKIYRPRMEKMELELERESESKENPKIDEEEEIYIREEEEDETPHPNSDDLNKDLLVFEKDEHSFTEN